jgi:hypothetical protein
MLIGMYNQLHKIGELLCAHKLETDEPPFFSVFVG